jgi:hypothetical protein
MSERFAATRYWSGLLGTVLLALLLSSPSRAETRRALLIGIDRYQPATTAAGQATPPVSSRAWTDLDGSVNDAEALRAMLVARYGFAPENILSLRDEEAGRERILAAIREHLIVSAEPGDVHLFYFAGHGSQVYNSRSDEPDKKDETLVPADAVRGAWDIRDKELSRLFNDVLDRGAALTVILDSCHSGSGTRGRGDAKSRFVEPDTRDVAAFVIDPSDTRPPPEQRGALILAAAQDFEEAKESRDEETGQSHGAFSLALLRALRVADGQESARQLFQRVRALLRNQGRAQEPVLSGAAERPLFGKTAGGGGAVAVLLAGEDGVELQGGLAAGLRPGTELKPGGATRDPALRLRVVEARGWSRATAQVSAGDPAAVRPGDLFAVDRWVTADAAALRVWLPPSLAAGALSRQAAEFKRLQGDGRVRWIGDPSEEAPRYTVDWNGANWRLSGPDAAPTPLAALGDVPDRMPAAAPSASLFVEVPPPPELVAKLGVASGAVGAVTLTASASEADYLLVGRWHDGAAHYAWLRPDLGSPATARKLPFPARTDWVAVTDPTAPQAAAQLLEFARRLARIKGWLQLEGPPDRDRFPYALAFKRGDGSFLDRDTVGRDEQFDLVLRADPATVQPKVEPRYVYVFSLDSFGNTHLLFPSAAQGNSENRLPVNSAPPAPAEIGLGTRIKITPPFGVDRYFLLSSREAVPDPAVLESDGVRARGQEPDMPLARLLYDRALGARGGRRPATPTDWGLRSFSLLSTP